MNPIWETKDGRFAVSMPGEKWGTYASISSAEMFLSGAKSLGNFLRLPITGGQLSKWEADDREIRRRFAKYECDGGEVEVTENQA